MCGEFRHMVDKNNISLPQNLTESLSEAQFDKMADISLVLEPLWENALGKRLEKHNDEKQNQRIIQQNVTYETP
jgi:hypothetical protein